MSKSYFFIEEYIVARKYYRLKIYSLQKNKIIIFQRANKAWTIYFQPMFFYLTHYNHYYPFKHRVLRLTLNHARE